MSAQHQTEKDEPRQHYINDESGECWAIPCDKPATHLLVTRARPDEHFPQGLLIEAGYCWHDAVWFAGAAVALNGGTFVSMSEHAFPPGVSGGGAA